MSQIQVHSLKLLVADISPIPIKLLFRHERRPDQGCEGTPVVGIYSSFAITPDRCPFHCYDHNQQAAHLTSHFPDLSSIHLKGHLCPHTLEIQMGP